MKRKLQLVRDGTPDHLFSVHTRALHFFSFLFPFGPAVPFLSECLTDESQFLRHFVIANRIGLRSHLCSARTREGACEKEESELSFRWLTSRALSTGKIRSVKWAFLQFSLGQAPKVLVRNQEMFLWISPCVKCRRIFRDCVNSR